MTPEAQRIAIAEACGWKRRRAKMAGNMHVWLHPDGYIGTAASIPDYLNDMNAMHEAECLLPDLASNDEGADQLGFCEWLAEVLGAKWASGSSTDMWLLTHATAAQRAEAFLRTIGKWQETAPRPAHSRK